MSPLPWKIMKLQGPLKTTIFLSTLILLLLTLITFYDPILLIDQSSLTTIYQKYFQYTAIPPLPSKQPPPPPPPPPPQPPILSPPQPPPSIPTLSPNSTWNSTNSTKKYVDPPCNISVGEWVRDSSAPYYTNLTCFTIQEHQNCMKYGRPDTDYLKRRWKPEKCELPVFDPVRFMELVRDKSMAFVGDSLSRNHMQSLMCLLSRVEYPEDISPTSDDRFKLMYYPNYNFTVAVFWSPFLIKAHEQLPTKKKPQSYPYWNLHIDVPDPAWSSQIAGFHYVIISGGNWFTRPSVYYEKRRIIGSQYIKVRRAPAMSMQYPHRIAFRTAFRAINAQVKYKGLTFLRTISPSHFENGTWDRGGDCRRTQPISRKETRVFENDKESYEVQKEEFEKAKEEGRRRGRRFVLMDITEAMMMRPDGHPSRYGHWPEVQRVMSNDCVHWCLPGPVDAWNDFLMYYLMST